MNADVLLGNRITDILQPLPESLRETENTPREALVPLTGDVVRQQEEKGESENCGEHEEVHNAESRKFSLDLV